MARRKRTIGQRILRLFKKKRGNSTGISNKFDHKLLPTLAVPEDMTNPDRIRLLNTFNAIIERVNENYMTLRDNDINPKPKKVLKKTPRPRSHEDKRV